MPDPKAISSKKRNAEATKARIAQMAGLKFTQHGFDGVGLREIALCAEVNIALISRYFGSKDQLFEQAILEKLSLDPLFAGAVDNLAEHIAHYMFDKTSDTQEIDPMIAMLRSAGSTRIRPAIKKRFEQVIITRMADELTGSQTTQRATLIIALLFGIDSLRRIFDIANLAHGDQKAMRLYFTQTLNRLLAG
jgi:AcrR family transcriptional regulator